MGANGFKIFPRKDGKNRSCKFRVECGEAALITGFCLPDGVSVCINKVEEDHCNCEYYEKEHCEIGTPTGIRSDQCSGTVMMPGCYVAILCIEQGCCAEEIDWDEEWAVYVDTCAALNNLQTLAQVAALGD